MIVKQVYVVPVSKRTITLPTYSSDDDGSGTPSRVQYDNFSSGIGLPSPKHCSSMRYPTAWYTVFLLTFTIGATVQQRHNTEY